MGFDEGRIVFDNETGTYFSGQTIYGKLVFNQDKVKTFRGIYAQIKGFCQVHWTTHHSRQVSDGRGGHRTESYTESHDSHEAYITNKIYLVGGESGEHKLQPGKHEFPFNFTLPANCPSSFEGSHGHIRYEIKVVVDRAFKFDQEKKVQLRVVAPLDLNTDAYCSEPIVMEFDDTYCCCCMSRGSCVTLVKVPRGGYCPGQTVPIEVSCENKGNVEIDSISFAIEQVTVYRATHHPGTKSDEDTVAKLKKGPVAGGASRKWTVEMEIPIMDLYNVSTCRYIDIDYSFVVKVSPSGCHEDSKQTRRFVIGTIPLRDGYGNMLNMPDQMARQTEGFQQAAPHFGPIVNQPVASQYPAPYPAPYSPPGQYHAPYPAAPATGQYPSAGGYPAPAPYPGGELPPAPGLAPPPAPGLAPPPAQYPPPYSAMPSLPPGANVPYPTGRSSPYIQASAPGLLPATPVPAEKEKLLTNGDANNPPYNPDFKDKV